MLGGHRWAVQDNRAITPCSPQSFLARDATEHVLVANHYIETEEALQISLAFVRARVYFGREHIPSPAARFVAYYDVRGRNVGDDLEARLAVALQDVAEVRVRRS